jgi:hypothetical protein
MFSDSMVSKGPIYLYMVLKFAGREGADAGDLHVIRAVGWCAFPRESLWAKCVGACFVACR